MSSELHARAPSRRQAPRADDPVLTSKLAPPRVPGWVVPRKRIERRIADGARGPLTGVTGPPGAGKTIAVASPAGARGLGPVGWGPGGGNTRPPTRFRARPAAPP